MARIVKTVFSFFVGVLAIFTPIANAQPAAEAQNVSLVGHNDLNGNGDGGEGLAIQQFPDGRRVLYLAHEGQKTCLSVVDVTHPESPVMINQFPSPAPGITRCNSLGLSGNVLAVANQTLKQGQKMASGSPALLLRHLRTELARRALPVVCRRRVRARDDGHS
jgi:hypothetical protein